jgi:hypothetical protein
MLEKTTVSLERVSYLFMPVPSNLKLTGPDRYRLIFDSKSFRVISPNGGDKFFGRATSGLPKLYVVSADEIPVYVGVTRQSMRNRLHYGWTASGKGGYHGYAWRHQLTEAALDIWFDEDPPIDNPTFDMETVEAEVVHLIRCAGQWPKYQTEIHFHPSDEAHRAAAREIIAAYEL